MVSKSQFRNMDNCSLQSVQFPSPDVKEVEMKNLKVRISCKSVGQKVAVLNENSHGVYGTGNKISKMNAFRHKSAIHSSDDPKVYYGKRREPPVISEVENRKRRKMDRTVMQQCSTILTTLMKHPSGWVFNFPVDPVAYNIPDYFSIISHPMDLGTIKTKLDNNEYGDVSEFEADVRLTFSNAMLYNPPDNHVYEMAENLDKIFYQNWKSLEAKWGCENTTITEIVSSPAKSTGEAKNAGHEMRRLLKDSSNAREAKTRLAKLKLNSDRPLQKKVLPKDGGPSRACSTVQSKIPPNSVTTKCGYRDNAIYRCASQNDYGFPSSGMLSERLLGQVHGSKGEDPELKEKLTCHMNRSDQESDGGGSTLDEEHMLLSTSVSTSTAACSFEGFQWTPIIDVELSAKKALRAAVLKSRFADTIFKAKQKTLLDQDKTDPVKMQWEKQRLERKNREEKAKIEAQIKAAEEASRLKKETELKLELEREREAARIALQKMEKSVDIEDNIEVLKDLAMFLELSPAKEQFDLSGIGLFLKEEWVEDGFEDKPAVFHSRGNEEEGEII